MLYIKTKNGFIKLSSKWIVTGLFVFLVPIIGSIIWISKVENKVNNVNEQYTAQLRENLSKMTKKMAILHEKIMLLADKEKKLLVLTGIEQHRIDYDEYGTGGTIYRVDDEINGNNMTLASFAIMEQKIDRLNQNLMKIDKIIHEKKDKIRYVPIIVPVDGDYWFNNRSFGMMVDPFTGKRRFHSGQDIVASVGTPVVAAADGIIEFAGKNGGFGKVIKIKHGDIFETVYAHLSEIKVKKGQNVKRGEFIGRVGNTGRSTGPHLHYEVHKNGKAMNPKPYLLDGYIIFD